MSSKNRQFFNIPNILTLSRIAVVPVIVVLLMIQGDDKSLKANLIYGWIAAGLFIAAGISDIIDGMIARRMGR